MKRIIKFLYNLIPYKRELYTLLKKVYVPKKYVYQHLHFRGDIRINVSEDQSFLMHNYGYQIENDLFWQGYKKGWEKDSLNIWYKLAQKSKIILDIGANTGVYALAAKAANPDSKVIAFEPVKRVMEKLRYNINLNNFDIEANEYALSNYNGVATIFDSNKEHIYSVTVNKNMFPGEKRNEVQIEAKKLKSYIEENNIAKVDLIKIDTETHEPEVLQGMGNYLALFKPDFIIEVLSDELGEKIEHFFKELDYLYFVIDEETKPVLVDVIGKSTFHNYLICRQESAEYLNLI